MAAQDNQEQRKQRKIYSTELINKLISDRNNGYEIDYDPFFNRDLELRAPNVPFKMTPEEVEEYQKCYDNPMYYAEKFAKFMTDHGLSTVELRKYQKEIIDIVTEEVYDSSTDLVKPVNRNVVWLAARQVGKCGLFSNYVEVSESDDVSRGKKKRFLDLLDKYSKKKGILYRIKVFLCKIYCKL